MAKKNNTKRKLVGLVSEESGIRLYYTKKNTMNTPDKLSLRKYDPVLRKHVVFTETKKNLRGIFFVGLFLVEQILNEDTWPHGRRNIDGFNVLPLNRSRLLAL